MHTSDIEYLNDYLLTAYQDTYEKYDEKQAVGALLAYLLKHDISFFSGKKNRDILSNYSHNDIGYLIIEFVIKKIGIDKEVVDLIGHYDIDNCKNYKEASNIVTNLLIRYDRDKNKIVFGDIMNIIKLILVHDKIFSHLVNRYVLEVFIDKKDFISPNIIFAIKYMDETRTTKKAELNGQKIINYIKNEYNEQNI